MVIFPPVYWNGCKRNRGKYDVRVSYMTNVSVCCSHPTSMVALFRPNVSNRLDSSTVELA